MPRKAEGPCIVDGCEYPKRALGYCSAHYQLIRKYGRTDRVRNRNIGLKCEYPGCRKPATKRGYCDIHRKRISRADPNLKLRHKYRSLWHDRKSRGILCQEWLDFDKFCADIGERPSLSHSLMRKDERYLYSPTNFHWVRETRRITRTPKSHNWHDPVPARTRERSRTQEIYKLYGLTAAQYDEMHKQQDGKCAICRREETRSETRHGRLMRLVVDHCHETNKVRALLCWRCNIGLGVAKDSIEILKKMIEYLQFHAQKVT